MSSSSDRHRPTKGPITSHSFNTPHGIEIKADTVRKQRAKYRIQREVAAMKYVQKHTSIPVPHVLDVQLDTDEHVVWFVMEKVSGVQLDSAWNKMDKAAQARTISQLKSYFTELHALRPPTTSSGRIESHSGGPAYDQRFDNMATCGPFASVKDFHDMLVAPLGKIRPDWVSKYRKRLPDEDDIVFAHADISGENILIDPATGHVTGILDWEMAGFWPRWWEYRKGMFGSRCEIWWMNILKQVMVVSECYEDATEADMDLELFV